MSKDEVKSDDFEDGLVPSVSANELKAEADAASEAEQAEEAHKQGAVILRKVAEKMSIDPKDLQAVIQQATAAQSAEIQALRAELETVKNSARAGADGMLLDENASIGGYPWMLWRKPDTWPDTGSRGWVTAGPGGATPNNNRDAGSYTRYLKKGMIPITRYGYVEPPKSEKVQDQFRALFKAYGNAFAAEFPASQVIAYKWHLNPPYPGIKFKQYEDMKTQIKHFTCEACGEQFFFLPTDSEAGNVYRAHLMARHKYEFRDTRDALKAEGLSATPYRQVSIEEMTAEGAKPS